MTSKVDTRRLDAGASSLLQGTRESEKERVCFGFLAGVARLKSLGGVYKLGHDDLGVSEANIQSEIGKGRALTITLKKEGYVHWRLETRSGIAGALKDSPLTYPEFVDFLSYHLIPGIERMTGIRPSSSELIAIDVLDECKIEVSTQSIFQSLKRAIRILPLY